MTDNIGIANRRMLQLLYKDYIKELRKNFGKSHSIFYPDDVKRICDSKGFCMKYDFISNELILTGICTNKPGGNIYFGFARNTYKGNIYLPILVKTIDNKLGVFYGGKEMQLYQSAS